MKRIGMLVLALVLTLTALAFGPAPTQAAACQPPDCFASPGCCFDRQCDEWCGGRGLGICQGAPSGCCACAG
jgi:hypothetical protein